MLVNTSWLLEYLEPACSESELLKAFVHMGLEVEAIHPLAQGLDSITIGFIRDKAPLPGTDGMYICRAEVEPGKTLQVVCASEHPIEVGWGVPVARGGTKLPTGIPVKSGRFHGVMSEGMICLDSELGVLARGTGLQVFHDESALGRRLVDLIEIPGSILDIKPTANRPEWLSLVGIAREVAAVLSLSLKVPAPSVEEAAQPAASQVKVEVAEPSLCRRYMCRLIRGVKVAKSPAWLSSRLRTSGNSSINNVVDVTNFVMRELGQPLHAFDFKSLTGGQIIVRKMESSESMELIDGTWVGGSSLLRPSDLKDPLGLATKLRNAHDPLSQYLRERFSPETQWLLENHDDSNEPSEAFRDALVDELNRLLGSAELFDEKRFAQLSLTATTRGLLERKPQGEDRTRLNRLLLEEAYPREVEKGVVVTEETKPLVIADAVRPVALAGIMGGKDTQIDDETVDVLLEAAHFDPAQIKKSLRELGLNSTDASYRFERGMDPNETIELALDRAAALIVQVAGGSVARGPVDEYVNRLEPKVFHLTSERVSSYLGITVSDSAIRDSLKGLGMKCSDDLTVEVPTRRVDVNDPVVLIEDVARLTGYDHIPLTLPVGRLTSGKRNPLDALRRRVTLFLSDDGFLESRNLSLESTALVLEFSHTVEDAVRLINSKEEMSVLRKSLLPGLLETISRNARRDAENFRYFELDRTFRQASGETVENWSVAAVAGGLTRDVDWSQGKTKINFFHIKGVVESLLETAGIAGATFRPASRPGFMEGQTAEISVRGNFLGVIGAVDKELLASHKVKEAVYAFEINLQSVLAASAESRSFTDIPRTPAVVRDIAVVLDTSVPYAEMEKRIREVGGFLLENLRCTDIYEGKPIERGQRSISVRLRFRDPQRTLSADEVSLAVDHIVDALTQEYNAKLRE